MFCAWFRSTRRFITNGFNSSSAISLGRPHWCSLSCGPTTMTATPGGATPPAVVEQRVHRLLQHPLLVVDDDLGRAEIDQPLEPVVAVDHTAVQIVEVRRGAPATVE